MRAGETNLSPTVRGIVSTALSDRTLLRHIEYVRVLEAEEQRLSQAPAEFQNSLARCAHSSGRRGGEVVRHRPDR